MKMKTIYPGLLASMLAMSSAQASEFDGGFVGARIGVNSSNISGLAAVNGKSTTAYGLDGGYNWDMQRFLLGVDVFADFNGKADHGTATAPFTTNYGSDAYGVDLKLGLPNGSWMPYGRLGYSQTNGSGSASAISGGDLHGGLGIEYKYTPSWGVSAEWLRSAAKSNGLKLENNNFTVGLRYYFGMPATAPAPVEAKAAPMPEQVTAPAPAPAQQERWKVIKAQTPVTIDGANFNFDSARLRPAAAARLQPVVDFAKKYPEAGIDVHGHTDSTGSHAYNMKLSERRAEAVKAYLVKQGIDASRITAQGFGETENIADNKTRAGRAKNRRVEIHYTVIDETKVRVTE